MTTEAEDLANTPIDKGSVAKLRAALQEAAAMRITSPGQIKTAIRNALTRARKWIAEEDYAEAEAEYAHASAMTRALKGRG